jgi:hypothetical protein
VLNISDAHFPDWHVTIERRLRDMLGKLVQAEARDPAPAWVNKLDWTSTGDIEHAAQKERIIEAPETGTVFGWNKELRLAWRKAGKKSHGALHAHRDRPHA